MCFFVLVAKKWLHEKVSEAQLSQLVGEWGLKLSFLSLIDQESESSRTEVLTGA